MAARRLRVLSFSTLYPNPCQPVHGVFVENRLRHLAATGEVDLRVVAPVPWRPSLRAVPARETRHGIEVWHPRYPVIPKLGMPVAPMLMRLGVRRLVRELAAEADFDVLDAHYFYPDGVAAAWLARELGKPVVITARGTDLNLIPRYPIPRAQIRWAAAQAAACITVCAALARPLSRLGVPDSRIRVLRNGVDLAAFRPHDRDAARRRLGLAGPAILSVGLLIERKGHHLAIDALAELPGVTLLVAGAGPDREALERRAAGRGVADRVRFLGQVPHGELAPLYSATDALVLASSREGWANVLLEAMACGTPVVATDVWGTAEAVTVPEAGLLLPERSAGAIAAGVRAILAAPPDRAATRRHAERHGWEPTTQGQLDLFAAITGKAA